MVNFSCFRNAGLSLDAGSVEVSFEGQVAFCTDY